MDPRAAFEGLHKPCSEGVGRVPIFLRTHWGRRIFLPKISPCETQLQTSVWQYLRGHPCIQPFHIFLEPLQNSPPLGRLADSADSWRQGLFVALIHSLWVFIPLCWVLCEARAKRCSCPRGIRSQESSRIRGVHVIHERAEEWAQQQADLAVRWAETKLGFHLHI